MTKVLTILAVIALSLTMYCAEKDPLVEVNRLEAEGKIVQAKLKFQEVVKKEQDPNLKRKFIEFCFKHEQYRDFTRHTQQFLNRFPNDRRVKSLEFEYYAILAKNAEKQKEYKLALNYVVRKLLDTDYAEHARWEQRQAGILTRWYNHGKDQKDEGIKKEALSSMKNLGFSNLAFDLDEKLYKTLE